MLAALIIVFREVVEAGIVVGIVLAATRTVCGSRLWAGAGVVAGILGSCLVALCAGAIASTFEGFGQELFNAGILCVAVIMLIAHNVWMSSHGRELAREIRAAGDAIAQGNKSLIALAVVVAVAVLREGSEIVLFLYGIAITDGGSGAALFIGGFCGLALGVGLSAFTYMGLVRISARHLFTVTGTMISLLAAGMAAQAASFLEQAGAIDVMGLTVWDSSDLLPEKSIPGRVLHTLVGYSDQPTLLQVVVYSATLLAIFGLMRSVRSVPKSMAAG